MKMIKKITVCLMLSLCAVLGFSAEADAKKSAPQVKDISSTARFKNLKYHVIPHPNSLEEKAGFFIFKRVWSINNNEEGFEDSLKTISEIMKKNYSNFNVEFSKSGNISVSKNEALPSEGYKLSVQSDKIAIEASSSAGCFYAFQTLRQMMELTTNGTYYIPNCEISDSPRFGWRGLMIDDARSFNGVAVIKKIIDQLALLKFNVLHMHLNDIEGWRIEIKKYPNLTEYGAWFDNKAKPGYYTKEDLKDIIAYAKARHIEVVPEIDVPGHATSAIKSYPWLGEWRTLDIGNPKVREFVEDVLKETMEIFPSKYMHCGGDEVGYADEWAKCANTEKYLKENNLENMHEGYVHYMKGLANFVEKNGKIMIGWNEVNGKMSHKKNKIAGPSKIRPNKDTVINFWRGDEKEISETANAGYKVINSSSSYTYFNKRYNVVPMERAYSFNPIPKEVKAENAKNILGMSCHFWGIPLDAPAKMYDLGFPRIASAAEVAWTQPENKNYERFQKNLEPLKYFWDTVEIGYRGVLKYKDEDGYLDFE